MGPKNKNKNNNNNNQQQLPQSPPQPNNTTDEIRAMKKQIDDLTKRVLELESYKIVSETVTETLRKEIDRLDQYGRRHSVVIRKVEKPAGETQAHVEEKVNSIISTALKMPTITKDIDKLHRIGRTRTEGGKTFQNIVVRFRSHRSRYALYGKKKDLPNGLKINAHLTHHRAKVLHESIDLVKDIEGVEFTYSNIHGDLYVRLTEPDEKNNHKFMFNSIDELNEILMQKGLVEDDERE